MGRTAETHVTQDIGHEICEREGIKAMLVGSIANLGSQYVINLDAVNARSGETLGRAQAQAASKEQVLKALGSAASEMRQKLGESLATVQKFDKPIEEVTTSSLEALKAYALGLKKRFSGDELGGIALLKHAIELDPNFAMAYARTAIAYWNLDDQTAEEYARKAYERVDRVSEPERYYILTSYDNIVTGNSERMIETYQLWIQNYPRDSVALTNLAVQYAVTGQFEKELEYIKRAHELDSSTIYTWFHLMEAYTALNRLDEAGDTAQQAIAHGFDSPLIHASLRNLAIVQNDSSRYRAETELLSNRRASLGTSVKRSLIDYAAARGQMRGGEDEARKSAEESQSEGLRSAAADLLAEAALLYAMVGNTNHAREMASLAEQASNDSVTQTKLGATYAYSGDFRQAHAFLDRLMQRYPENTLLKKMFASEVHALEAIQRRDGAAAVAALENSRPYDFAYPCRLPYVRGLSYLSVVRRSRRQWSFSE